MQLSRLTIILEEPAAAAQLLSLPADSIAASYDILAVQPMSERVLQQVLPSLAVPCSLLAGHEGCNPSWVLASCSWKQFVTEGCLLYPFCRWCSSSRCLCCGYVTCTCNRREGEKHPDACHLIQ